MAVDARLIEVALEYVEGGSFERFFQSFFPEIVGVDFIPLGGMHDGGADAFDADSVSEGKNKPTAFYQSSIEDDHRGKIRRTVRRLQKFGRDVRTLTYVSSRVVPALDKDEETLSEELGVTVRIRDRKWIAANINHSAATMGAFDKFLRPSIAFLSDIGGARLIDSERPVPASAAVCVFLGQEVERRRSNSDLLTSITDSLILWALDDTDPDKGKLMGRDEILARIEDTLPTAKKFVRGVLDHRLEELASKRNTNGREIRWYKKQDKFCLPYETRQIVENDNVEDEALRVQVLETFERRADRCCQEEGIALSPRHVAELALKSVQRVFEKEGLQFASFLTEGAIEISTSVVDKVDEVLKESAVAGADAIALKAVIMAVLRQAFYDSEAFEREYFGKLSRTFTLLFSLSADAEIINYFRGMSSNFILYVGADLIIQALSERYLKPEDRMASNMLKLVKEGGATLILSEPTLEEVWHHLVATDVEFRALFEGVEQHVKIEHARHASKILIRAYFYGRLRPLEGIKPAASWRAFIGLFCTYAGLHKTAGKNEIKQYLLGQFGMSFESYDDLAKLTDEEEVVELAARLTEIKHDEVLAENDARQILAVYGKRNKLGEQHKPNPYGYRTWWLTHEAAVRRCTGDLVDKTGAQYILRPEFVLNFIALSPKTEEIRRSYRSIFPSILGMTLSNRMRDDVFKDVMRRVKEVRENDEARVQVMMGTLANRLKADVFKRYEASFAKNIFD